MSNKPTNQPLVSICIPSYNHQNYISKNIESIISQDYQNIELIIIDDNSADNSDAVINSFVEQCKARFVRFEYIKNIKNKGISYNLNQAIKWAQGKYFYAIASDDILMPFKTSLLVLEIEKLDDTYAAIFGDALFINDNGEQICTLSNGLIILADSQQAKENNDINITFLDVNTKEFNFDYKSPNFEITYAQILQGNYLPAMSCLIKIQCIKNVKNYTNGNAVEDLELWLKLLQKYKFAFINKPVAYYRWHSNNSMKIQTEKIFKAQLEIVNNQRNFAIKNGYENIFINRLKHLISVVSQYDKKCADFYLNLNKLK